MAKIINFVKNLGLIGALFDGSLYLGKTGDIAFKLSWGTWLSWVACAVLILPDFRIFRGSPRSVLRWFIAGYVVSACYFFVQPFFPTLGFALGIAMSLTAISILASSDRTISRFERRFS